jgi:hypothetical protein
MIARARTKWPPIFTSRRTGPGHPAGHINGKRGERMNAPLIERRELAPRLEAQVRAVSAEPGAPMRLTRYFRLTGWVSWLPTRRGSKQGRWRKANAGVLSNGKQYN